jgi:hypothetical protein
VPFTRPVVHHPSPPSLARLVPTIIRSSSVRCRHRQHPPASGATHTRPGHRDVPSSHLVAQHVSAPPPPARNPPPRPSDPPSSDRRTNFRADGVLSPHGERIPSQPRVDQTPANNRTRGAGHRAGGAYCAACAPPQPLLVLSGTWGGSVIATALGLKTAVRPAEFLGGQGPLLGLSSSAIGSYRGHSPSSSRPRRRRGEQCLSRSCTPSYPSASPP